MHAITPAWRAAQNAQFAPAAHMRISFGITDSTAAASCVPSDNGHEHYSSLTSLLYVLGIPTFTYATFEPLRIRADGAALVAPDETESGPDEGFVSRLLCDENGVFSTPIIIHMRFPELHTIAALTFAFDTIEPTWPISLGIRTMRNGVLLEDFLCAPTGAYWQSDAPLTSFDEIELSFYKMNKPHRRARLEQLLFGIGLKFDDRTIKRANQKMDIDPIMRRLPENRFEFSLANTNTLTGEDHGMYDPDNPSGLWKYIERQNPISVQYGQEVQSGETEWISGGHFYLTAQPSVDGDDANFTAHDLLSLLDNTYYKGVHAPSGRSLYALAQEILLDANPPRTLEKVEPWTLWDGLKCIKSTAPMPMKSHRECLHLIAHAACCVLFTGRDGLLHLEPIAPGATGEMLDFACMLAEPVVTKIATLRAVECPSYNYVSKAQTSQLHKGSYEIHGQTALHITYPQSDTQALTLTGARVISAKFYAQAADILLEGNGIASVVVDGYPLEKTTLLCTALVDLADKNGSTETLDNVLITSPNIANTVAAHTREHLLLRNTYTVPTRGLPQLDALDNITMQSRFASEFPACILVNELAYSGAISGSITAKRLTREG